MPRALTGATIWSENHSEKLLPFYRDMLGLKPSFESEGFVVLGDLAGPTLALGTHSEVHGPNKDAARHMVGLSSGDIRADSNGCDPPGVQFIEEPTAYGNLLIATLADPEGNIVQLLQTA